MKRARRRAVEELLRPRPDLLDVHPPGRSRSSSGSRRSYATEADGARRQPGGVRGRTELRRDRRAVRPPLRGAAGDPRAGHLHATSTATPRSPGVWSPRPSCRSCRWSTRSYPITPASDILHELSRHKRFGVRTMQAEDEIAAASIAIGAAFAGALGGDRHLGPGPGPEGRGAGPGDQPGAADAGRRRAARRPVDGHADQDRADRPAAGHVRPPRRVAAADRGRRGRRRTASRPRSRRPASR